MARASSTDAGNMKPASAKSKGRLLQQAVAAALLERFPGLTVDDIKSTPMGVRGADLQLSARARQLVPYAVECKAVEKLNVWAAWDQCRAHVRESETPLLVCRRNRTSAFAVIPWEHFLELIAPVERTPAAAQYASLRDALQRALGVVDALCASKNTT